jgi:hypothetical protein
MVSILPAEAVELRAGGRDVVRSLEEGMDQSKNPNSGSDVGIL